VIAGPAGTHVVIVKPQGVIQQSAVATPSRGVRFRPLAPQVKASIAQTAEVAAQPSSGPFVLSPRTHFIDGRGSITLNFALVVDPLGDYVNLGMPTSTGVIKGTVDLYGAGSPTTKAYMVHWQVEPGAAINYSGSSSTNFVMSMLGGGQYIVPAKGGLQDIVTVVVLPEPINRPWGMMSLTVDVPRHFFFYGVEVTPM
jgi:hypothetical protein